MQTDRTTTHRAASSYSAMARLRARHGSSAGFTLIELMIVVGIILILLSITVVALLGLFTNARVANTEQGIRLVERGLDIYKRDYSSRTLQSTTSNPDGIEYGPPRQENWPDSSEYAVSEMSDGEFLRFVLFPSVEEVGVYHSRFRGLPDFPIFERGEMERFLNERDIRFLMDPTEEVYREVEAGKAIVDGWQQPMYYRFPGLPHTLELDSHGRSGQNNFLLGLPDLWSAGEDAVSGWGDYGPDKGGYDARAYTNLRIDPSKSGQEGYIDDVTNWFMASGF